jgi:MoxR-like ATPase
MERAKETIDLRYCGEKMTGLAAEIGKELINIEDTIKMAVLTIFAHPEGRYSHFLLEAPPGMGKTVLCKTIAGWCNLRFTRIQLTPDMQPGEIVMTRDLEMEGSQVRTKVSYGPIFTNILLADEINRTPPRTQSAILQPMAECETTYGGRTYPLGHDMSLHDSEGEELRGDAFSERLKELYDERRGPWRKPAEPALFYVFATQNPVENEGTYRLPEAQLDRFLFKMELDYPQESTIQAIVKNKSVIRTFCRAYVLDRGRASPAYASILDAPPPGRELGVDGRDAAFSRIVPALKEAFFMEIRPSLERLYGFELADPSTGDDAHAVMDEIEGLIMEARRDYKKAQPKAAMSPQDVISMRYRIALSVGAPPKVYAYVSRILDEIRRNDEAFTLKVSPRCLDTIVSVAKAHCVFRTYSEYARRQRLHQFPDSLSVSKEDINACAINMLPHRVALSYEAQAKGASARGLIAQLLRSVKNDPAFNDME